MASPLLRAMLIAALVVGVTPLRGAAASLGEATVAPAAPAAHLELTSNEPLVTQDSKLIFSSWQGEEYDDSYPPVIWPRAVRVAKTSEASFVVHSPGPPDRVEIRIWKRLRPNGIPKGPRRTLNCVSGDLAGDCQFSPTLAGQGIAWKVAFDVPDVEGHTYISVMASWEDSQVAWINHAILQ